MAEAKRRYVRFQRANYLVSDLERALLLYRDVLGLHVEFIKDSEADSYSYPVFEIDPAAALRFAVLSSPTQPRVMALTEVQGVTLAAQRLPRRAAIVLEIKDIDGVVADCAAHGFTDQIDRRLNIEFLQQ